MPLLTIVQLFVDGLLFVLVTTILLSLVTIVVTSNLMWSKFALVVATLIEFVVVDLTTNLMQYEFNPIAIALTHAQSDPANFAEL